MQKTSKQNLVDHLKNDINLKNNDFVWLHSGVIGLGLLENGIDTFTESDIEFWKGKAETRFHNYTPGNGTVSTNGTTDTLPLSVQGGVAEGTTTTEDIPF